MSRSPAIAAAAIAAALGAAVLPAAVPGPRQPIEHLGLSGANFLVRSGQPGCFTGSGSVGAGFAVPRGAMVTGATLYVIDNSQTAQIFGELNRHDFTNGGTYRLKSGSSGGVGTNTVDLVVDPGFVLPAGNAINLSVTIGSGTCLKGAEVHFIRNPESTTVDSRVNEPAPVTGLAANGAPAS